MTIQYSPFQFVNLWENLTKQSEELFFWERIDNISQYFIDISSTPTRKSKHTSELLGKKDLFTSYGTENLFIEKLAPGTIKEITSLLNNQPNIQQVKFHFKKILELKNHERFLEELYKTMIDSLDDPDSFKMQLCMEKIIKFMLDDHVVDTIKQLPRRIFAKKFFDYYKAEIIDCITSIDNRTELFNTWYELPRRIIHEKIRETSQGNNLDEKLNWMFTQDVYWEQETQILTRKLIQNIVDSEEIRSYFSKTDFSKKSNVLSGFADIAQDILRDTVKNGVDRISYCFLVNFFAETDLFGRNQKLDENQYCEKLSKEITRIVYGGYRPDEHFQNNISETTSWKFFNDLSSKTAYNIHETKAQETYLADLIARALINEKNMNPDIELNDSIQNALHRFGFVYSVQLFYRKLARIFARQILETIDNMSSTLDNDFVESLIDSSAKNLFHKFDNTYAFGWVPNQVNKEMMAHLINGIFEELSKPKGLFRIHLLVGDCDFDEKMCKIGNVIFYDAREWDFGEGNHFDLDYDYGISIDRPLKTVYSKPYESFQQGKKTRHRKRNSGRAYIDVLSSDYRVAAFKAQDLVRKATNPLVFAFADNRSAFRPQIPINFHILDLDTKHIGVKMGSSSKTHDKFLTVTDKHKRIFSSYDRFVSSSNSQLKEPVLRALEWFHRGLWEDIPHEKFISFWIGLEQLITSTNDDKTKSKLLKLVPRLVVTWKETPMAYSLWVYLNGLIDEINNNSGLKTTINQNTSFINWERNTPILLENLELLKSAFASNSVDDLIIKRIEEYFLPEKIEMVKNNIRILRHNMEMKVAMLYAKRNQIVHEGLTYDPQIEIFCKALEPILRDVLTNVLKYNYAKNLEGIVYETNRPYQALVGFHLE